MNDRQRKIELDDLFFSYPSITDPNFSTRIAEKKEFNELAAPPFEPTPERAKFFLPW